MTRTFDRNGQSTLMICTSTGHTAGEDLSSLGDEAAKLGDIFVINIVRSVNTEAAHLFASLASTAANFSFGSISHSQKASLTKF